VQGRLRNERLSVEIETACKHCDRALHLTADSEMRISAHEAEAAPLVFIPDVDWEHFSERTIIDAF
jgi:hypothetical protein